MVIVLSTEAESRLKSEALRRGMAADQLVEQLIHEAASRHDHKAGHGTLQLFEEWERDDATEDPQEIARRQAEFEEFKQEMNSTRLATDGPDARIPFL